MTFFVVRPFHLVISLIAVGLVWNTVRCCENSTTADSNPGSLLHPSLSSCVSEIVRAICGALRPSPIKRNTELINSILGLPRILQDAGR